MWCKKAASKSARTKVDGISICIVLVITIGVPAHIFIG